METQGMHVQAIQSVYKQCRFYMNIFLIYVYIRKYIYICEQSYLFYLFVGFN